MGKEYHVALQGNDLWEGTKEKPFATISKATRVSHKGDTITVHEGTYRECIEPSCGGDHELNRITFQAAKGEKVIIKGSEIIKNWKRIEGTVWQVTLSNKMFGTYNPYSQTIDGDWMIEPVDWKPHTGEVYLNGRSFYEAHTLEEVRNPKMRQPYIYLGDGHKEYYLNPTDTLYQWYAEVDSDNTKIYANFQGLDPNDEMVEINVRKYCFYPALIGVDYITIRGFEMAQVATPWAPPTSEQYGMIGTHWSKGWIIENNILHDAKCSAISLGKEASTGDGLSFKYQQKSGYQHQLEAVFAGRRIGWCKERIGSHIIRNNVIYNCGQNGIVGHMGCAFSQIYNNHIYNIGIKHEFFGWEIAAIKFHAAIDTQIYCNCIHSCTLGFWMDWEAQGTRISRNLFYNNSRDGNIEVTHGPLLIDNNIFASSYGFDNHAQGTAFVNNLICGHMYQVSITDRATPYHLPHSTEIAGYAFTYGGDERYFNNIFVGKKEPIKEKAFCGTSGYNRYTSSYDEFRNMLQQIKGQDHEKFFNIKQPVYINNNMYLNGASAFDKEIQQYTNINFDPHISIEEVNHELYLVFDMPCDIEELETDIMNTSKLGSLIIADTIYDAPDGTSISIDHDYFGIVRQGRSCIGPFHSIHSGKNRLKVWSLY